jgi:putative ABC transport system permease protein
MLTLLKDIRYSLRTLLRMPGFSIVAVLVLALGIGANTAIFSVVNSVVLRPLPYPGADRLALIWETDLKDGIKREGPSGPNFLDWKEQSQSFEEMALPEVGTGTLTGNGEPEQVVGLRVTTNFLSMLGARTVLGRAFTAAEGEGKARFPVAVLTNGFWKRRFASDVGVIGRTFYMNSEPYTVIGVLAPDFWQSLPTDRYVPWPTAQLRAKNRVDHDFGVIARLKPGVTLPQAQVELSTVARRIDAQTPRLAGWDVTLVGMKQALFEYTRPAMLLLLGAVGLLLLLRASMSQACCWRVSQGGARNWGFGWRWGRGAAVSSCRFSVKACCLVSRAVRSESSSQSGASTCSARSCAPRFRWWMPEPRSFVRQSAWTDARWPSRC